MIEKDLDSKLKEVDIIADVMNVIKDEEWTYAEFYLGDFTAHIAGSLREMFKVWKVKDLPEVKPHGLAEDHVNFAEAEKQVAMTKKVMEVMGDLSVEEANKLLNAFIDAIGKEKARKLGPIILSELGIRFPTKEEIITKHEASQTKDTQPSDELSV